MRPENFPDPLRHNPPTANRGIAPSCLFLTGIQFDTTPLPDKTGKVASAIPAGMSSEQSQGNNAIRGARHRENLLIKGVFTAASRRDHCQDGTLSLCFLEKESQFIMQVPFRRVFSVAGVLTTLLGLSLTPSSSEAGFPWHQHHGRRGLAYGAYAPAYPMSVGYAPAYSTFYGPDITVSAGYGACDPCGVPACDPCGACSPCGVAGCDPCGGCSNCVSGNCVGGNCAGGNCGSGYTPSTNQAPVPDSTPTQQQQQQSNPPSPNPPAANPPTYNNDPPPDDFRRVPNRNNNNEARPQLPNNPMPNDSFTPRTNPPSGFEDTNRSTVPSGSGSTIPTNPNTGTNPQVPSSLPPANPGGNAPGFDGRGNALKPSGEAREPAPMEPATPATPVSPATPATTIPDADTPEPLPFNPGASMRPIPIETPVDLVVHLQIRRQRVIVNPTAVTHSVARLPVAPAQVVTSGSEVLAKK